MSIYIKQFKARRRRSGTALTVDHTAHVGEREKSKGEANDCTVRAVMHWLQISYDEAHAICEESGRIRRHGWKSWAIVDLLSKGYGMNIKTVHLPVKHMTRESPTHKRWGWDGVDEDVTLQPTLTAFIKAHPVGNFYCRNADHAFVVRDGVVFDANHRTGRTRIHGAYRLAE